MLITTFGFHKRGPYGEQQKQKMQNYVPHLVKSPEPFWGFYIVYILNFSIFPKMAFYLNSYFAALH